MSHIRPERALLRASATQLLTELVAIPSVNPGGSSYDQTLCGEDRVADFLAQRLVALGAQVTRQAVTPHNDNLIAILNPGGSPRIVFDTHLDTVRPGAGMTDPFTARIADNRLYGLGACDQKGGMSAGLTALEFVINNNLLQAEVTFVGTALEESGGRGAQVYAPTYPGRADLVIVSEPTQMNVLVAHKGVIRWAIEVHGRAAHAATPRKGQNAIYGACRLIEVLRSEVPPLVSVSHPLLGEPTLHVGSISGGVQCNIVPDRCRLQVERRLLPGEDPAAVEQEVQAIVDRVKVEGEWPAIELQRQVFMYAMETDPQLEVVEKLVDVAQRNATHIAVGGAAYTCDAGAYSRQGHPTVIFGPGDITHAHTPHEWIDLDELTSATAILVAVFAGEVTS